MRVRWVFCLAIGLAACAPDAPRSVEISSLKGSPQRGEALFQVRCLGCHRKGGLMKTVRWYPKRAFLTVLLNGTPGSKMPAYSAMSDQDIADLYAHIEGAGR